MIKVYIADVSNLPDPLEYPEILTGLPDERIQKTLRYRQAKDRKQSLGAGLLLKKCLNEYNINIEDMRYGRHGKPELEGICFNLSHSYDRVVCVVSDRPVGCDIEKIRDMNPKLADRFFTKKEIQYLEQFHGNEKRDEIYRFWTMKESYMKMTGEGMSLSLDRIEFSFDDRISVCRDGNLCDCHIKEYKVPGYKFTVCSEEYIEIDTVIESAL